jgi:hypothetical protein
MELQFHFVIQQYVSDGLPFLGHALNDFNGMFAWSGLVSIAYFKY